MRLTAHGLVLRWFEAEASVSDVEPAPFSSFSAEGHGDVETAKALCRECPARAVCLAGALERREPWGVWGGDLFPRGVIVLRKRPRGQPRKTRVAA